MQDFLFNIYHIFYRAAIKILFYNPTSSNMYHSSLSLVKCNLFQYTWIVWKYYLSFDTAINIFLCIYDFCDLYIFYNKKDACIFRLFCKKVVYDILLWVYEFCMCGKAWIFMWISWVVIYCERFGFNVEF